MEKRKYLLKWTVIPAFLSLVFLSSIGVRSLKSQTEKSQTDRSSNSRSDMVVIDDLKGFGRLERPAVIFLHDLHTDAMEKQGRDCKACHQPLNTGPVESGPIALKKERLSVKFNRPDDTSGDISDDTSKEKVMDIYHDGCIGCHKETAGAGKKAGPIEVCGECHGEKTGWRSARLPMGLDKSLHFRHTEANRDEKTGKGDCGRCHHEYDEKAKKLFYTRDKEGSCRYCHLKETEKNRISMRMAAHLSCIQCHKGKLAEKKEAGPVKCAGCHDPRMQQKIEKLDRVPRLDRKQPDVVLIRAGARDAAGPDKPSRMFPVPFDHKSHEASVTTCIACHHASLSSCTKSCHTPEGSKEGNFVKLEGAMHLKRSEKSCLGCHEATQRKPECAACHLPMAEEQSASESSCLPCHMKPLETNPTSAASDEKKMAAALIASRKAPETVPYKAEDIPEKVVIKGLSEKYEPVEMPHRKIIDALLIPIKDNRLTGYFHRDAGTICKGCHHNSPISDKPPRCSSCHGKPFDERNPFRPGIKGAYHQQCMGCHQILNLERPKSTECIDCHKEKKTSRTAAVSIQPRRF